MTFKDHLVSVGTEGESPSESCAVCHLREAEESSVYCLVCNQLAIDILVAQEEEQ